MFNMSRCYDRPIVLLIVPPIVDQACTFQCLIPMGDLSKYNRCSHASPSGYGPLVYEKPESSRRKVMSRYHVGVPYAIKRHASVTYIQLG